MKSTALLGTQLVVNALTGYAFQKMFAYYYGASIEKSIFDIAFQVPTMLIYLSGLGFTHAIVVSLFTRLRNGDQETLHRIFASLTNASLLALTAFVLATALLSGPISDLLAPGLGAGERAAMRTLILWMLPLALTFGISSYLSAVALAWRVPVGQEILLLIARLVVIAYVIANGHAIPLVQIAAVLVGSTLTAVAVQWVTLSRITGLRYRVVLDLRDPAVRGALHQFGGFFAVAVASQIAFAYGRRMGTIAGPSVVAFLGFASSLIDPLGAILGKVLAFQIGQPFAARLYTQPSGPSAESFRRVLVIVILVGGVIAGTIAIAAAPLINLFFGGGAFQAPAVIETARYLRIMAIGLPGAIALWVLLYPLLALGRHTAACVYVVGYVLQVLIINFLFGHVQGAAVAWGYSFCMWIQAIGGWLLLKAQMQSRVAEPRRRL